MKENEAANARFLKIFHTHNELDERIINAEKGHELLTDIEIDNLKKEKLRLKDEAYNIILKYKKDNNL
jgi:uncharacterized protein YdcH (DUF465 family)